MTDRLPECWPPCKPEDHDVARESGLDHGLLVWIRGSVPRSRDRLHPPDEQPVHVFILGATEWWTAETWPLPSTGCMTFYFHRHGHVNILLGDGVPSADPPKAKPPDSYCYDPTDLMRFLSGLRDGPVDDHLVSMHQDLLCYASEVLAEPLEVVGPITCTLHAASSAFDTGWRVRLADVYPDGSARFLCYSALRTRVRESYGHPQLLESDTPNEFRVSIDAAGNHFLPGHQIRIAVVSRWFPKVDRNLNTGAENKFLDTSPIAAHRTIFHDRERPSCVVLPAEAVGAASTRSS